MELESPIYTTPLTCRPTQLINNLDYSMKVYTPWLIISTAVGLL